VTVAIDVVQTRAHKESWILKGMLSTGDNSYVILSSGSQAEYVEITSVNVQFTNRSINTTNQSHLFRSRPFQRLSDSLVLRSPRHVVVSDDAPRIQEAHSNWTVIEFQAPL